MNEVGAIIVVGLVVVLATLVALQEWVKRQ